MLVVVKVVVVVEVDGMVLSDSVDSDMLELDMLESALDNGENGSESSWPEVDSEANAEELAIVPWVEAVAIDEASSEVDDSSGMVDVEPSTLVENESDVIVDGDPEDENVVDSPGVVMISEEELDGCWEVENVVENEKVVLVTSMHKQSVQKSVTTSSRQQSPPS